jgi:hypothetical protein
LKRDRLNSLDFNEVIKEDPKVKLTLIGKDVPDIISGSNSTWEMMKDCLPMKHCECNLLKAFILRFNHINQATVCVFFPSCRRSVSLIEAMAMQKAIVAQILRTDVIDNGIDGF